MPLDPPKPGETQEHFISYCIGEEVKSGKDVDQAAAICYSKWEAGKMTAQKLAIEELKKYVKSNSR